MNIDTKTAALFIVPMLGIAAAWGQSINRIDSLEKNQEQLVTTSELEIVKTKIFYIEKTVNENKAMLTKIWSKLDK